MEIYDINENALNNYRYNLYECIKKEYAATRRKMNVVNEVAKNGSKYMTVIGGDRRIRVNSCYSPEWEAKRWASICFEHFEMSKVIVLYGLGNGYCASEIISNMTKSDILIIYEPFVDIFMKVIKEYDLSNIISDERVYLYVGEEAFFDFKYVYSDKIGVTNYINSYELIHPKYFDLDRDKYALYKDVIKGYRDSIIRSISFLQVKGKKTIDNLIYSYKHLKGNMLLSEFFGKVDDDQVAVIIAAGPSLAKNIDDLTMLKNKAFLFATDAAVTTLLEHDIIPDAIAMIDPEKDWKKGKEICNYIPLVSIFEADKDMLSSHLEKIIYYTRVVDKEFMKMLEKPEVFFESSGSVATTILNILLTIGFKNIVFVGQDLAYSDDGRTHVDHNEKRIEKEILVEGIYGDTVKSRGDWINFKRYIEDIIPRYRSVNFIDATEGGAYIKGTDIMKLSDVCDKFKLAYYDYSNFFDENIPLMCEEEEKKSVQYFENMIISLHDLEVQVKKLLKYSDKITRVIEEGGDYKHLVEYKRFEELLTDVNKNLQLELIYDYDMNKFTYYLFARNKKCDNEHDTIINYFCSISECFKLVLDTIPEFIEYISKDKEE